MPPTQSEGQLAAGSSQGLWGPHLSSPHWVRVQRLLSGPWVQDSGVSGQALAVAPDGKLLFSGGHWDGSLRVTSLHRGKLLNQITRHLGMSSLEAGGGACLR